MKYLLQAQFPEEKYGNLDWIHKVGDKLIEALINKDADFDGHDYGSGEVNFFIYTNDPRSILAAIKNIFIQENALIDAKIAYREVDGEVYTCLWPEDLTEFK